jgi:midasin
LPLTTSFLLLLLLLLLYRSILSLVKELANEGYMLLAERLRREEEKVVIKEVLEKHLRVTIDVAALYSLPNTPTIPGFENIVWTESMRRLFTLGANLLGLDNTATL